MSRINTIAILALLAALPLGAPRATAADGDTPDDATPATDYASFSILMERNIFDPDRSPAQPWRAETETQELPRPVPEDTIDLLGTMITPDWSVAIFQGSNSEFNRKCRIGETVAGLRIDRIGTDSVALAGDGDTSLTLPVGYRMQRHGDTPWAIGSASPAPMSSMSTGAPPPTANIAPAQTGASPATPAPASGGSGGGADEILKRMMERRQQEIKK